MNDYLKTLEAIMQKNFCDKMLIEKSILYAKRLLDNNLPIIFDWKHFSIMYGIEMDTLVSFVFAQEHQYVKKIIPKKNHGIRILCLPSMELKKVQRWILDHVLCNMHVSQFATGFKQKSSIKHNAIVHLNSDCLINLDIKDFFPSICFEKIFMIFNYYGYSKKVSYLLASLCCYENRLPQGAPTSPYLSNIVCLRLDKRISSLIAKYIGHYTRYADDITISGKKNIANTIPVIRNIISEEGFNVNNDKTRIAFKNQRQNVTGLNINNGIVSIPRKYRREVKQEIYFCKKYGVDEHLDRIKSTKSFYKEHLYGKVMYINMINKDEGKKLFDELDKIKWDY